MAKQFKIFIAGTIGNVTFYELNGKPVARAKAAKVRQTKATKASAKDFGRAVRWSREIRQLLDPLLAFYKDRTLMYRLNAALLKWIRESGDDKKSKATNILQLLSLELNEEVIPARRIKIEPTVDMDTTGKIFISIPALKPATDLQAPKDTRKIICMLVAVRCNTDETRSSRPQPLEQYKTSFEIDYNSTNIPAQQIEIPFDSITGDIILVAMGLTYITGTARNFITVRDKKWLPGKIIGAKYKT